MALESPCLLKRKFANLPDPLCSVTIQCLIIANQGKIFLQCLSNEHPIKWIAVSTWQKAGAQGMLQCNRESLKILEMEVLWDFSYKFLC
jgi:hypothetical protein